MYIKILNEISVLKLGLKHGILIRPRESEMVVIMKDIYDRIVQQDLLKKGNLSKHCVQTELKSFTYSYLELDLKNYGLDQNKIKICGALRDLVAFVQFKKREKHPWKSVNFSKVASLRLY